MGLITNNISMTEQLLQTFEANKWLPITINMPQNNDKLTLIPHFNKHKKPNRNSLRVIEVKGSCMPMSGDLKGVTNDILHYDDLIKLKSELDKYFKEYPTNPEEEAYYAFEEI